MVSTLNQKRIFNKRTIIQLECQACGHSEDMDTEGEEFKRCSKGRSPDSYRIKCPRCGWLNYVKI